MGQLKLDELIRAERNAHNALLDLDELSDQELERLRAHYIELARRAPEQLRLRGPDTGMLQVRLSWWDVAEGDAPRT